MVYDSGDNNVIVIQVVLAGDPMQLGPVLRSSLSKEYGLQVSYLERIMALEIYQRNEMMFANHGAYDPMLVSVDNNVNDECSTFIVCITYTM